MSMPSVLPRPVAAGLAAAALLLWFGTAVACDEYAEEQALAAAIAAARAARAEEVRAAAVTGAGEAVTVAAALGPAAVREPVETAAPTRP